MRKIRFETMVPAELLEAVNGRSLVYQPVGSMEWHGPHMGMGMDTINAHAVALEAARRTGGVVMPPLYIGTETPRSPETLRKLGFSGDERVVGMDFPQNSVASFYWPPDLFEAIIRRQTQMLLEMGFSQVVLLNGHGADAQVEILERVSRELSVQSGRCVMTI
ncbi:MAG: creatininase family protein, partial [Anaerotruncus colihominis]